jgi:hypothetical protein
MFRTLRPHTASLCSVWKRQRATCGVGVCWRAFSFGRIASLNNHGNGIGHCVLCCVWTVRQCGSHSHMQAWLMPSCWFAAQALDFSSTTNWLLAIYRWHSNSAIEQREWALKHRRVQYKPIRPLSLCLSAPACCSCTKNVCAKLPEQLAVHEHHAWFSHGPTNNSHY